MRDHLYYTVGPLYLWILYLWIQPTVGGKYLGEKFQEVLRNKTWICSTGDYLHRIYFVLGMISNLEIN